MVTIMTATYNRGYTLSRLYESLELQTNKAFEWLVVDDGSTDDTLTLLENFQLISSFPIRILNQQNSGKHIAINTGVSATSNEWVFFVDSDDALSIDAVEVFIHDLQENKISNIVGYCYRRAHFSGALIGKDFSKSTPASTVMTPTEAGNYYQGDLAYIFRSEVLSKCPFPYFKGEKFVPELLVWNKISDEGGIKYFDHKAIYFCEYLEDGYSNNFTQNLRRNPLGFGLFYRKQISREKSLNRKLKCLVRYFQCQLFRFMSEKKR